MSEGLLCECRMPLIWRKAALDEATRQAMMREAALLLAAINQMESGHEIEAAGAENRRLDRLEAKLDLALHLLARALEPAAAVAPRPVNLSAEGAEWQDRDPPAEGVSVILEIRPSEALPLNLNLIAEALAPGENLARVRFTGLSEELNDALVQFVFRRHRQAIRARSG
jgi:hypothetical protein